MVAAASEELMGDFETDAAVCWVVLVVLHQNFGRQDIPPVTRTISFAMAAM
jgi:hypothetical protein